MLKLVVLIKILASLVVAQNDIFDYEDGENNSERNSELEYFDPALRIVNGINVNDPRDFPFMVSLETKGRAWINMGNGLLRYLPFIGHCGGSLIRSDAVLTAAHCFNSVNSVKVSAGFTNHANPERSKQTIQGRAISTNTRFGGDIGIVFLSHNFTLNAYVQPIALGIQSDYYTGMTMNAIGWGRDATGVTTDQLNRAELYYVSEDTCSFYSKTNFAGLMCGAHRRQTSGVCMGDSGGPLVKGNPGGPFVLVGVVSGGPKQATIEGPNKKDTCDPRYPSFFMKVSYYNKWIREELSY